jgi:transposase
VPGEPPDHALGRSRGGLSTKIHALADLTCTPVMAALTGGQAGDNPMLATLVKALAEGGYEQDFRLLADKAYSHPSTRTFLRGRKIKHTIPEKSDQIARRKAKGSKGGTTTRVRQRDLQAAQHHRTLIQPGQAVARTGHPLRQVRRHLLGRLHSSEW